MTARRKGGGSTAEDGTRVQSVRLRPQDKELIEKASEVARVSISRFIQEAAATRARDVLNWNAAEGPLRRLAQAFAEATCKPTIHVTGMNTAAFDADDLWFSNSYEADQLDKLNSLLPDEKSLDPITRGAPLEERPIILQSVEAVPPPPATLAELIQALESAPTEFARLLADQLKNSATSNSAPYRPTFEYDAREQSSASNEDDGSSREVEN